MCVWLPNWPIQRVSAAPAAKQGAAAKQRAIVLHEPAGQGRAGVIACSRRAAETGVRRGMPLAEALSLLGSEPARVEPYDATADRAALVRLAEWCHRFSPRVGLAEETGQTFGDSLLFDITGCERLYHGEQALADGVARQFRERGLVVRLAIADTIGAAWGLARYLGQDRESVVIPAGQTEPALAGLPVAALRLPPRSIERLRQLGIASIGQLEKLPRSSLPARFGNGLLGRLDQALGRVPELFVPLRPLEPLRADWTFEHPTQRSEILTMVVETLVERVVRQLEQRQQGADALRCWFYLEPQELREASRREPVLIEVGLFHTNASAAHLGELIRMQMEHLRLPQAVSAVRVEVPAASPLEEPQAELFPGAGAAGPTPLSVLVERLTSRLGRASVVQPELIPDPQPECAVRYEPMVARRKVPAGDLAVLEPETEESPAVGRWRPLRMAPQPLAVEVTVAPDGQPIRCLCRGHEHRLVGSWGPERIETGWWREGAVRRDYYRVETASGCRFWLFHRLSDGKWFLHGWFE